MPPFDKSFWTREGNSIHWKNKNETKLDVTLITWPWIHAWVNVMVDCHFENTLSFTLWNIPLFISCSQDLLIHTHCFYLEQNLAYKTNLTTTEVLNFWLRYSSHWYKIIIQNCCQLSSEEYMRNITFWSGFCIQWVDKKNIYTVSNFNCQFYSVCAIALTITEINETYQVVQNENSEWIWCILSP